MPDSKGAKPPKAVLTVLLLFGEMSNPETDPRSVKMMGCRTRQQTFYPDIQFLLRAVVNFGTSKSYSFEKLSKLAVPVIVFAMMICRGYIDVE